VKTLKCWDQQWTQILRGEPIDYADLNEVAAIVAPGDELDAATRRRIIAAVERAGIRLSNYDALREWIKKSDNHVSLTGASRKGVPSSEVVETPSTGRLRKERRAFPQQGSTPHRLTP
jgi:hypothetical protein